MVIKLTVIGFIAKGSVDAAMQGRHYYRCMSIHKESFAAFVQLRVETITDNMTMLCLTI